MRKRVPLVYSAALGWHVDLPTYEMVPGSVQPFHRAGLIERGEVLPAAPVAGVLGLMPTVVVLLPDDWPMRADGQLDAPGLRAMYRGSRRGHGRADYQPPRIEEP